MHSLCRVARLHGEVGGIEKQTYLRARHSCQFDVKCGSKVVIPAGTTGVKIAFGQSRLKRYDENSEKYVPMNVYIYKDRIYHA